MQLGRCAIHILVESINRSNRISPSRVPYRHKSFFTRNGFTPLHHDESYETVYGGRAKYREKMRPAFANFASMFRTFICSSLQVGVSDVPMTHTFLGVIRCGRYLFRQWWGDLFCLATLAFVFGFSMREVAHYTTPLLIMFMETVSSIWNRAMATDCGVMWCFCLLAVVLYNVCARRDFRAHLPSAENSRSQSPETVGNPNSFGRRREIGYLHCARR